MGFKLEEVKGIGKETANRLTAAGIDTVEKLASSKPDMLQKLNVKGIGAATAKKYIENAKFLLKEEQGKTRKKPESPKEKPEKKPINKKVKSDGSLKKKINQQAECNIGLVGHVDHGMNISIR